ncbi:Cell adhesion molecule 3, partial [Armadillidium nasatum]
MNKFINIWATVGLVLHSIRKDFPEVNRSNARRVLLHNLTFNSTGTYRCEVSADAPHFRTYTNESRMVVVEFPKSHPIITGAKSHYRVGETAWLNCTSSKSHPAAQLTWFINREKADERNLRYYHKWIHKDGLESIRLGLVFK